jgi:diguanylate cyclase (GGDEF)-like protein
LLGVHDRAYECLETYNKLRSHHSKIAAYWNSVYKKLNETLAELRLTQATLASRTQELERLSLTDALTGLANRRHLHARAAIEIENVRRSRTSLAVALFDVDHFKRVNDTYGHDAGDSVLQHVAHVAAASVRPVDFLARLGGEEFALLIPDAAFDEALAVAERIRRALATAAFALGSGERVCVTASFGVTPFDVDTDSFDSALGRADGLCYAAKRAGRNNVQAR